jgi:hypothetical protein
MITQSIVRDPDGVPHRIVGLTWVFALGAAIISFVALISGGTAAVLAFAFIPLMIGALDRSARQARAVRVPVPKHEARTEIIDWRGR